MWNQLPGGIYQRHIAPYLTIAEIAILSQCSKHLKTSSQEHYTWAQRMEALNVNKKLISAIASEDVIKNHLLLYRNLSRLPAHYRIALTALWEIHAISGDLALIEKLNGEYKNALDCNVLHLCAASGNPEAIRYARKNFSINPFSETKHGSNITNFALHTRTQAAVDVCRNEFKVSPRTDINDCPPVYDVIESGLASELKLASKLREINKNVDASGKNALLIAATKGDVRCMALALSVGLCMLSNDLTHCNVLHCAVKSGSITTVHYASNRAPTSLFEQKNTDEQTPIALARELKFEEAELVLKNTKVQRTKAPAATPYLAKKPL